MSRERNTVKNARGFFYSSVLGQAHFLLMIANHKTRYLVTVGYAYSFVHVLVNTWHLPALTGMIQAFTSVLIKKIIM